MGASVKSIFYLTLFFACNTALFSQNFLQWQEGEYSSYHIEWKEGNWESLFFQVNKKLDANSWEMDVIYRTENLDALVRLQVPVQREKNALPANPIGVKVLRGKEMNEQEFQPLVTRIFNLLAFRNADWKKMKTTAIKESFCCNIKTAAEFEDVWDSYSLFHSMSDSVPILGLVQSRKSNNDFTTRLTSFGKNTLQIFSYKTYPTFIDFYNLREVRYPNFSIRFPSSWLLQPMPSMEQNTEIWIAKLGGNIHAGYLIIKIKKGESEKIQTLHSQILLDKGLKSAFINQHLQHESDALEDPKRPIFQFALKQQGQVGKQLSSYVLNEDKTKLAEIILFTNFADDNPDRSKLPEIVSQFKEIIKSFQFVSTQTKD